MQIEYVQHQWLFELYVRTYSAGILRKKLELPNLAVDDLAWNGVIILELGPCRGRICQRGEITTI